MGRVVGKGHALLREGLQWKAYREERAGAWNGKPGRKGVRERKRCAEGKPLEARPKNESKE